MKKEQIREFIKYYINTYEVHSFNRNKAGQIIVSNGACSLNLEIFLEDVIEEFIEFKSDITTMKPKITKQNLAQLNKMNKGAFIEVRTSLFERFYDYIGNILSGGKSFAPAELKGFR